MIEPLAAAASSNASVDTTLIHNFLQKNPSYLPEFTFPNIDGNFICNLKVISEETRRAVVNVSSKEYSNKKEAKKEASSLAVIELKKIGLM